MKKYLLLFLLFSGTVYGEWTKTGFSDESTMFIDTQTIKKTGDLVRVTYLLNLPLGTKSSDDKFTYKSSKTVQEFDCKKNLTRTISFQWYSDTMGKGKKVYEHIHTFPFEKIDEGTLINGVKKKVCQ
jgi:hypothetical protein